MAMSPEFSIDSLGNQYWIHRGKFHRDGGPSVIWVTGGQEWHRHGKLHREDGPAIAWPGGNQYWYLNGKLYSTNKEYQEAVGLSDQDMTAILMTYGSVT